MFPVAAIMVAVGATSIEIIEEKLLDRDLDDVGSLCPSIFLRGLIFL